MSAIFSKRFLVQLPVVVLFVLVIGTGVSGYFYYKGEPSSKATAFFASFVSGLCLVTIQFLFGWAEYRALAQTQRIGIKRVLLHRDDRSLYENMIRVSQQRISVMGVTAQRFMEHFADAHSDRPETKVLHEALSRGVQVKILVPRSEHLSEEDKIKATASTKYFRETSEGFKKTFAVRFFSHLPTHSIVIIDDECILGPVFPSVASRHTPALYMDTDNQYARKYLDYFEKEWAKAERAFPV